MTQPTHSEPAGGARGYIARRLSDSAVWSALLDAPMASLACDDTGELLFANAPMIDLLERPIDALVGNGWMKLLCDSPEDMRDVFASTGTIKHRRSLPEGRVLEMTCSNVKLPDGQRGIIAIAIEARGAQAPGSGRVVVEGGQRGYRELVEDAPDLFGRYDPESGRPLFLSRAIERLTGFSPEEFFADRELWQKTVAKEYRAIWDAAIAQVRRGDARAFDLALVHRDGRRVVAQQALYPVRDPQGGVRFIEGTARDITAVRQIEALKAKNEETASLERLKSQLLANVSHELRTPLVSIKGYNELLVRGALGPLTPRQKRGLEIAGANTERLIELIETLLDFASREEGRLELRSSRIDLRQPVEDAVQALSDRIASRSIKLRVELGDEPLWVAGDRARLAQVFRALLGNAEKFSEASGGEILVRATAGGEYASIAVADRGIGIPKAAHARIFDRFYQVDASSTRKFGGAGLGLALAKELVTLHGGTILVESDEGRGSTFTVRLPRVGRERKSTPTNELARPVLLVGAAEPTWQKLRPLLEDDALNAYLFCTHSAHEVLVRARRHRPDLVVLALPDGEELDRLIAELKHDPETKSLPVVALTDSGLPIPRADLVVERSEPARLTDGILRLLGRRQAQARPPRVVIVEDELEILDFTRFVLEREGFEVTCVAQGEQALSAVDGDVDLVILDIALEGSDGIEICRSLKATAATSRVPILIMTAMSGDEVRELSIKAGADGYLMKPFGLDEFLRQVQLHLRGSDASRARETA